MAQFALFGGIGSDGRWCPGVGRSEVVSDAEDEHSGSLLRDAVVGRVEGFDGDLVAGVTEVIKKQFENVSMVACESADVLKEDGFGVGGCDPVDEGERDESAWVGFVDGAGGRAEGLTGWAAGEEVDIVWDECGVDGGDVFAVDRHVVVLADIGVICVGGDGVGFECCSDIVADCLEAVGESAGASTEVDCRRELVVSHRWCG